MRVLIVEDDREQREYLERMAASWGHQVRSAANGSAALEQMASFPPSVIVTDLIMPVMDGFQLMENLRSRGVLPPTIVLTAYGNIETAVATLHKHGGFWFLEKPVDVSALRALLERAAEQGRLATENERLRLELSQRGALGDLVGESRAMQEIFALIRQVATTEARVLITGESGTGKELVARAIHSFSRRSSEPFVAINCAALPETLIENELFGHEKGAFTGAIDRGPGALEMARGGTLFLDEIGEMPVATQPKLLRVLEDLKFRRLGGHQELTADIRVISATNRAPGLAIKEGKLREDLYYRLNVFHVDLPPLRERVEDIPPIVSVLIQKINQKHGTRVTHATPEVLGALSTQPWSGNVRQLRNTIERAVILAGEGPLLKSHLLLPTEALDISRTNAEGLGVRVGMTLDESERILIEATLKKANDNRTRAATLLGITPKTLYSKLKQYRLEDKTAEDAEGAAGA